MNRPSREYLVERFRADGYEGLSCPDAACGCDLDDIAPCGCDPLDCVPAYKVVCPGEDCALWSECGEEGGTCYTVTKPEVAR
ncbi:MAG: hypothetical protein MUQ56_08770 [Thermoleophilia bacterium]|nr:hypothetical protein [Thermoleophilia bacterium]